jgi:hypothetical protein
VQFIKESTVKVEEITAQDIIKKIKPISKYSLALEAEPQLNTTGFNIKPFTVPPT